MLLIVFLFSSLGFATIISLSSYYGVKLYKYCIERRNNQNRQPPLLSPSAPPSIPSMPI